MGPIAAPALRQRRGRACPGQCMPQRAHWRRPSQGALPELDFCARQQWQTSSRCAHGRRRPRLSALAAAACRLAVGSRPADSRRRAHPPQGPCLGTPALTAPFLGPHCLLPCPCCRSFCDLEMTDSGSGSWLACDLLLEPEEEEYRCAWLSWGLAAGWPGFQNGASYQTTPGQPLQAWRHPFSGCKYRLPRRRRRLAVAPCPSRPRNSLQLQAARPGLLPGPASPHHDYFRLWPGPVQRLPLRRRGALLALWRAAAARHLPPGAQQRRRTTGAAPGCSQRRSRAGARSTNPAPALVPAPLPAAAARLPRHLGGHAGCDGQPGRPDAPHAQQPRRHGVRRLRAAVQPAGRRQQPRRHPRARLG